LVQKLNFLIQKLNFSVQKLKFLEQKLNFSVKKRNFLVKNLHFLSYNLIFWSGKINFSPQKLNFLVQKLNFLVKNFCVFQPFLLRSYFLILLMSEPLRIWTLSVRSLLFALFLIEHHCFQNQGSLKSEERLSDFKEQCAALCIIYLLYKSYRYTCL